MTKKESSVDRSSRAEDSDYRVLTPPSSLTVEADTRRPVLYSPDGRALVRLAGFRKTQP